HLDYSGTETRTAVFLYESLAQLAFVYPARHLVARPVRNRVLDGIVVATVLLQVATVAVPGLRTLLGLAPIGPSAYLLITAALVASSAGAFLSARLTRGQ
ncbi:MAG: cation transporting ATPase C-terminal domain-containing protein, partial [Actinomycetota bacterium]